MPWIRTEHGAFHVKMAAPPRRRCCGCGQLTLRENLRLCDARLKKVRKGRKTNTCNKPICTRCTTIPAEGKDLCPNHAAQWEALKARPPLTKPKDEQADTPKQERLL